MNTIQEFTEDPDAGRLKTKPGSDYQHVMTRILHELEGDNEAFEQFCAQKTKYEDVYESFRKLHESKEYNYPVGLTLPYRIWRLMKDDWRAAENKFEELSNIYPTQADLHEAIEDDEDCSLEFGRLTAHVTNANGHNSAKELSGRSRTISRNGGQ